MPKATPGPADELAVAADAAAAVVPARWPVLKVPVPPEWKHWLEQAAEHRAMSVAVLVRQCIRELMISRHGSSSSSPATTKGADSGGT